MPMKAMRVRRNESVFHNLDLALRLCWLGVTEWEYLMHIDRYDIHIEVLGIKQKLFHSSDIIHICLSIW